MPLFLSLLALVRNVTSVCGCTAGMPTALRRPAHASPRRVAVTPNAARRVAKGDGWRQWADYWRPGECFDFWQALRRALDLQPAKQSNGGLPPKRKAGDALRY